METKKTNYFKKYIFIEIIINIFFIASLVFFILFFTNNFYFFQNSDIPLTIFIFAIFSTIFIKFIYYEVLEYSQYSSSKKNWYLIAAFIPIINSVLWISLFNSVNKRFKKQGVSFESLFSNKTKKMSKNKQLFIILDSFILTIFITNVFLTLIFTEEIFTFSIFLNLNSIVSITATVLSIFLKLMFISYFKVNEKLTPQYYIALVVSWIPLIGTIVYLILIKQMQKYENDNILEKYAPF